MGTHICTHGLQVPTTWVPSAYFHGRYRSDFGDERYPSFEICCLDLPLLTFGYYSFDYLSTCLILHLMSAACSPCLWNQCCECGVSTTACTIPTPMPAPYG